MFCKHITGAAGGTLVQADSFYVRDATHVVVQHAQQAVCSKLTHCILVSFTWVFCSVRANKILNPADDKVQSYPFSNFLLLLSQ